MAAQGLSRVHRTCALFSDAQYRNEGIHASHNVLTRDGIHPAEFQRIAREQISAYQTTDFVDIQITNVANTSRDGTSSLEVSDATGHRWCGRTVVFAMGCKDIFRPLRATRRIGHSTCKLPARADATDAGLTRRQATSVFFATAMSAPTCPRGS